MSELEKMRALALLEGGMKQREVAKRVNFSVKTIQRLKRSAAGKKPSEVPKRKSFPGSGKRKSYGAKERAAVKKAIKSNAKITCTQLKIRWPKTLGHLSRRTLNTIIKEDLGRRSSVAAIKPFLTDSMRENRLAWATGHRYWGRRRWGRYLYGDEKNFWTKNDTGGRRVRRPVGSSRADPKYTRTPYKHPQKLMAWCAISASGRRVIHFLGENETMTSARYASTLEKSGAVNLMMEDGLLLYHDKATPHQAGVVSALLKREGVKSKFTPGNSPDLMPVENAFGRMDQILEERPTKTLKQLRTEVRRAWNSLPNSYLTDLCNSMPDRVHDVIANNGFPIGY